MIRVTINLPAFQQLVVASTSLAGTVTQINADGSPSTSVSVAAGGSQTIAPSNVARNYALDSDNGTLTYAITTPDPALSATDAELSAVITQSIGNGDTTHVPSADAVFDALALKANAENGAMTGMTTHEGLTIGEKTPINAVASSKVLTIGTNPIEAATVSIGGVQYKFRADALGAGVAASKTITSDTTEVADGDTVTIGSTVYRFKDTPAQAYDVQRHGTVADTTMENLIKAINATGTEGVEYFAGTLIHPSVIAGALAASAFTVTANDVGFAGNSIALAESSAHLSWAGAATFLSGGIDAQAANDVLIGGTTEASIDNLVLAITAGAGAGTSYGTGTVTNPLATAAKASSSTMTATNKIKGAIGNSTALTETLADGSWAAGATFLSGGVDGTVGVANETCADASYIYHCVAANTISDANWMRVSLGTVY